MTDKINGYESAVLLLGSNLGDRRLYIEQAIQSIGRTCGTIKRRSSIYKTGPWGNTEQPEYLNAAIVVTTLLTPAGLWARLSDIEQKAGRERTQKWGPRTLDLDILYYGTDIIDTPSLTIPHPGIALRKFTLIPLCELLPDFAHPVLKKSHRELLMCCPDQSGVESYEPHP